MKKVKDHLYYTDAERMEKRTATVPNASTRTHRLNPSDTSPTKINRKFLY